MKVRFDISCELSAKQTIHMNFTPYFSLKSNNKRIKLLSATVLPGALRVNIHTCN